MLWVSAADQMKAPAYSRHPIHLTADITTRNEKVGAKVLCQCPRITFKGPAKISTRVQTSLYVHSTFVEVWVQRLCHHLPDQYAHVGLHDIAPEVHRCASVPISQGDTRCGSRDEARASTLSQLGSKIAHRGCSDDSDLKPCGTYSLCTVV